MVLLVYRAGTLAAGVNSYQSQYVNLLLSNTTINVNVLRVDGAKLSSAALDTSKLAWSYIGDNKWLF